MRKIKKEREGRSIQFEPDVVRIVEDYRRRQARIPSFSEAVNEIIRGKRPVETLEAEEGGLEDE